MIEMQPNQFSGFWHCYECRKGWWANPKDFPYHLGIQPCAFDGKHSMTPLLDKEVVFYLTRQQAISGALRDFGQMVKLA